MSPRDIDALVAEHCMGWRVHFRNTAHYVLASEEGTTYQSPQASVNSWHPSTDPAASKQLRDKMHWEGWYYCIRLCDAFSGGDGKLYCHFYKHDRDVSGEEWADTEEMAVALAALSAVGKPVAP